MDENEAAKPGKRARTRQRLIEIAAELFFERGVQRTSLHDIAVHAGTSTGAIYSSFASKEELVAEVVAATRLAVRPRLAPGMSAERMLELFAEDAISSLPLVQARSRFVAEVQLYALSHEGLRQRLERDQAVAYEEALRLVEGFGLPGVAMTARQIVLLLQALTVGLFQQRVLYPTLYADADVLAAYRAVAVALGGRA